MFWKDGVMGKRKKMQQDDKNKWDLLNLFTVLAVLNDRMEEFLLFIFKLNIPPL